MNICTVNNFFRSLPHDWADKFTGSFSKNIYVRWLCILEEVFYRGMTLLWHCWLDDRKDTRPAKSCPTYTQRFCFPTKWRNNWGELVWTSIQKSCGWLSNWLSNWLSRDYQTVKLAMKWLLTDYQINCSTELLQTGWQIRVARSLG